MVEDAGGYDGDLTVIGVKNMKRLKKLLGLELVKRKNSEAVDSI